MTGNGYLAIRRRENEMYYLVVNKPISPGTVIEFVQGEINTHNGVMRSKTCIKAPQSIKIFRKELILEEGGLEVVIEKAKQGRLK